MAAILLRIESMQHASHGCLGRAIFVENRDTTVEAIVRAAGKRRVEIFAAYDQRSQARRLHCLFDDESQMTRGQLDEVDPVFPQCVKEGNAWVDVQRLVNAVYV